MTSHTKVTCKRCERTAEYRIAVYDAVEELTWRLVDKAEEAEDKAELQAAQRAERRCGERKMIRRGERDDWGMSAEKWFQGD